MDSIGRLRLGTPMALLGAIGMVVAPWLGLTTLGRPWSFIVGFTVGVLAGCGAVLSLYGLIGLRQDAARRSCPGNRKDLRDR